MATMDLFAGGASADGIVNVTSAVSIGTDGANTYYNATYSDCYLFTPEGGSFKYLYRDTTGAPYTVPSGNYVMSHMVVCYVQSNLSDILFAIYDQSGRRCVGMVGDGSGNYYLAHNTGTDASPVWVQIGTTSVYRPANGSWGTIDVQLIIDSAGNHTALLAANGNLVAQGVFSDTSITGATGVYHAQLHNGGGYYSQLYSRMNGSTIGAFVKTTRATGAGQFTDWTGSYTDVNEPIPNTATFNQVTTAGAKQSYPMTNIAVPTGCTISSAWHWISAKNDGQTPENVRSLVYDGGTEYDESSNFYGSMAVAFSTQLQRYDTSPATSAAWTQAEWNGPVQFGFISEA